jgi:hypothetical protein
MKCHEVMDAYVKLNFRKHPSLSGILLQKVLRSSPATGLTSKVQSLEKTVNTVAGSIASLKSRVSAIETKTSKIPPGRSNPGKTACEELIQQTTSELQSDYGESVDVGHLLRSVIAFCKVKVLVVSDSSWMWALACAQLGIGSIMCLPIS